GPGLHDHAVVGAPVGDARRVVGLGVAVGAGRAVPGGARDHLGGAARGAEEGRVRAGDGDDLRGVDAGGAAALPDVVPFEEGQDLEAPAAPLVPAHGRLADGQVPRRHAPVAAAAREDAERVVVVVEGEAQLLEVVAALDAGGGVADLLHRGYQEADQDGDDG